MKKIKVKFVDYENFMIENNFILEILRKHYEVEISNQPDILFYSVFNKQHYDYNCIKVLVSAEPVVPDFNEADYAISSCDMSFGNRHLYYPYYFMLNIEELIRVQEKKIEQMEMGNEPLPV